MKSSEDLRGSALVILCFGDVVGRTGRISLKQCLPAIREKYKADLVIANGENAAGGTGLDQGTAREIFDAGVDVITLGDHTWQKKDLHSYLDRESHRLIRPANYPDGAPGKGWTIVERRGIKVGIFNLMGRVFMNGLLDCPFRMADAIVSEELSECPVKILDIHAEATSEKIAIGRALDGRVSLVFGTHTHVQTADETVFPQGTGFITDLGMTGSPEGVIGMDQEVALNRFVTGMPHAYKIAAGDGLLCGIAATIDPSSGKAISVTRIRHSASATPE